MQIQPIQTALKAKAHSVVLLGREVDLDTNSGIFVTMNPAGKGYGGRQKLPDNLKQLFRPVVMSKPDSGVIAEVTLFSEGFREAKDIGKKLIGLFTVSRQLLSQQQHYDWGLRSMMPVLKSCGGMLRKVLEFLFIFYQNSNQILHFRCAAKASKLMLQRKLKLL